MGFKNFACLFQEEDLKSGCNNKAGDIRNITPEKIKQRDQSSSSKTSTKGKKS